MYEKIKKWYNQGLWTKEMVQKAFEKNILTSEEVGQIIGVEEEVG